MPSERISRIIDRYLGDIETAVIDERWEDAIGLALRVLELDSQNADAEKILKLSQSFNEESLKVSGIIYGSYAYYLAWGEVPV